MNLKEQIKKGTFIYTETDGKKSPAFPIAHISDNGFVYIDYNSSIRLIGHKDVVFNPNSRYRYKIANFE